MTNVVISIPVSPQLQEMIVSIDPDVHLTVLPVAQRLIYREGQRLALLYKEDAPPNLSPEDAILERRGLDLVLAGAEVLATNITMPADLLDRAPNLRWLQLVNAGIDRLMGSPLLESPVIITNASGIHGVPIAEWVMTYMLYFAKNVKHFQESQHAHQWRPAVVSELSGQTIGIVGLGAIGSEVARLAKAFNMQVLAVRRTQQAQESTPLADLLLPPSGIEQLLRESDYLVLALPLTAETRGIIGERELRMMKRNACLINIARGGLVDHQALSAALREGWISHAALDATEPEPLPPYSGLWDMPNVLITPHITPSTDRYVERAIDLFCQNLRRYLHGEPLINVVNKTSGY